MTCTHKKILTDKEKVVIVQSLYNTTHASIKKHAEELESQGICGEVFCDLLLNFFVETIQDLVVYIANIFDKELHEVLFKMMKDSADRLGINTTIITSPIHKEDSKIH